MIGALYAYGEGEFEDFDAQTVDLLRRGLMGSIVRHMLSPQHLFRSLGTALTSGLSAKAVQAAKLSLSVVRALIPKKSRSHVPAWQSRLQPPSPRRHSRSTAFEAALRSRLFGDKKLTDSRRHGVEVVFNATELRTGTAMRFGSKSSMAWRYGRVSGNDVSLAGAVSASAAYPAFLPAFHRKYRFESRGRSIEEEVILTDGGVYDNLGVSCLDASRRKTDHVYECDAIVCCSAGMGQWGGAERPYGWMSRMNRVALATFRKNEDSSKSQLFAQQKSRSSQVETVILAMLGQKDERLLKDFGEHSLPCDFVPREAVMHYPTDFNAMPEEDIEKITLRGRQLAEVLMENYWSA